MIKYQKVIVKNALQNQTAYAYLRDCGYSDGYLKKIRKSKNNLLINNTPSIVKQKVVDGDVLSVNQNPGTKTNILPINSPLNIVFEDDFVLVVNKPSGLSSMANRSHYTNNLAGQIVFHCSKTNPNFTLRMVNRLDKDTQGLIIVAKTLSVYKTLLQTAKKTYHAVLQGNVLKPVEINLPIKDELENGRIKLKRVVCKKGKPAQTFVKPIQNFSNYTLCQIQITHGRTHQIRVHTSHIGHSIEGDYIYSNQSALISHTALVCKKLSFYHPIKQKELCFEVPYGKSFLDLLESLQK